MESWCCPCLLLLTVTSLWICQTTCFGNTQLTTSSTMKEGEIFTMNCSTRNGSTRAWYRSDKIIFRTCPASQHLSVTDGSIVNPSEYRKFHFEDRLTLSCNSIQHTVRLVLNSTLDNRSVWWCRDDVKGVHSAKVTVVMGIYDRDYPEGKRPFKLPVTDSFSNSNTNSLKTKTIYIIAGSVSGFVLLVVVVIVILAVKRRRRVDRSKTVTESTIRTDIATDILNRDMRFSRNDCDGEDIGVYAHINKVRRKAEEPQTSDDLYAKPDKRQKQRQ